MTTHSTRGGGNLPSGHSAPVAYRPRAAWYKCLLGSRYILQHQIVSHIALDDLVLDLYLTGSEDDLTRVETRSLRFMYIYTINKMLCYTDTIIILVHLTYLLTPWGRVLLEKLTGSAAIQEIPRIFGTWRFITVFTSVRHLSLSWANSIQSPQPPPTSWRSILILSCTSFSSQNFKRRWSHFTK